MDLIIMSVATIFNLILVVLLFSGKKYYQLLEPLDSDEFILKDAYGIGLRLLELKKEEYRSKWFAKQMEYLEILYDKKYVAYYLRIYCARRLTLALVVFTFMLNIAAMGGEDAWIFLLLAIFLAAAVYQDFSNKLGEKIEERSDQMTAELPEIVNRLALLINAGMILREAWTVVSESGNSVLYQEMRLAHEQMLNGVSESDSIFLFGRRSENSEVRKFASQLIQSIDKGGSQLSAELTQLSKEMIEVKRQYVFRKADMATSKLLAPMFIMFAGVLFLVAAPILANMM